MVNHPPITSHMDGISALIHIVILSCAGYMFVKSGGLSSYFKWAGVIAWVGASFLSGWGLWVIQKDQNINAEDVKSCSKGILPIRKYVNLVVKEVTMDGKRWDNGKTRNM